MYVACLSTENAGRNSRSGYFDLPPTQSYLMCGVLQVLNFSPLF